MSHQDLCGKDEGKQPDARFKVAGDLSSFINHYAGMSSRPNAGLERVTTHVILASGRDCGELRQFLGCGRATWAQGRHKVPEGGDRGAGMLVGFRV